MRAWAAAVTIVAVALLGSGCSGSSDAAPTKSPDPCSLLATADLDQITTLAWTQQPQPEPDLPTCNWTTPQPPGSTQVFISGGGGDAYDSNKKTLDTGTTPPVEVKVEGADDAFQTPDGTLVGMKVGQFYVQVSYATAPPAENLGTVALQIASKAAVQAGAST